MLRRPNRASWNEGSAGSPSPLAQLLATPQPLRGIHADNSFVGARHSLPGQIGFGPTHQHPVAGTQFTGGQVSHPQAGLVHAPQMPTFSQANSHAGSSVAASLAALGLLTGTPHGGAADPTLPPPPAPPVPTATPRPVQPTMTTGLMPAHGGATGTETRPDPNLAHGGATGTEVRPDPTGAAPVNPDWLNRATGTVIRPNPIGLAELLTSIGKRGVFNV